MSLSAACACTGLVGIGGRGVRAARSPHVPRGAELKEEEGEE